jgi:hypothetical protein
VRLRLGALDPVHNLERALRAERGHLPGGDVLDALVSLRHDELREDRDGLEVDGKGPGDVEALGKEAGRELALVHEERKGRAGCDSELREVAGMGGGKAGSGRSERSACGGETLQSASKGPNEVSPPALPASRAQMRSPRRRFPRAPSSGGSCRGSLPTSTSTAPTGCRE